MIITAEPDARLRIGKTGENGAVRVVFPFAASWEAEYGAGAFSLLVQRPGDPAPYAVPLTREGDGVVWTVSDTDTAQAGRGKAELNFTVGSTLAKSITFDTLVTASLAPASSDPPSPWESWMDDVLAAGGVATAARDAAVQSAADAAGSAANAADSAEAVEDSADAAEENALKAEGYAVGTQNGVPARSGQPYYQDNAAYYAVSAMQSMNQAGRSAADAELWAKGSHTGGETPSDTNNSKYWAEQAGTSAGAADSAAAAAAASAQAAADSADAAADVLESIPPDYSEAVRRTLAAFPQESVEGSVVDFADGADGLPVADLTVQIEGVQAGTGDPSPDNIRPITGWTGVDLRRTGKNLWGGAAMLADIKAAVPAATVDETAGEISYHSNAQSTHPFLGVPANNSKPYRMVFKENTQYTLILTFSNTSLAGTTAAANIAIHYTDGTYSSPSRSNSEASTKYTVAFATARGKTVRDIAKITFYGHSTIYTNESGLFEGVLTADDFEPYVGTSYPITFPAGAGTVYGGSLDVTTGVLTVNRVAKQLTSAEDISVYRSGSTTTSFKIPSFGYGSVVQTKTQLSSHFTYNRSADIASDDRAGTFLVGSSRNAWVQVPNSIATTVAELKAWLDTQEVILSWLLEQPQTYQLTPTEVTTLLGWNTLYADTGDVAVKYRADPQMYTDGRLAAVRKIISGVEDGFTASHNYAVGDFLIVGDALYRVTAAIATGGSITPDTNVTATTVAEQLKALYASIA